ncbi:MAG: TIGR04282 family arsenosugar biosynthesis glycosyltransferase, partial [Promethearchaeota archaeon]
MDSTILIFTKVPIPGVVKTRLTQNTCLTETDSAKIAEAMLKDTISLASKTNADRIQIGYYPEENLNKLNEIIDSVRVEGFLNKPVELLLQVGSNFDQLFGSVIAESFKKNVNILVVIGADLPFLDHEIINKALETLTTKIDENPIIIGPSSGGGIYLVGITNMFDPNWFSIYHLFRGGVELSNFAAFSKEMDFSLVTLPPYGDIDIEEDLVSLVSYITLLKNSEIIMGFYFPYFTAKAIKE